MSLYECDPQKHKKCKRKSDPQVCQGMCFLTTVRECSTDGRPLSEEEQEEIERELEYNKSGNNREATKWERGE